MPRGGDTGREGKGRVLPTADGSQAGLQGALFSVRVCASVPGLMASAPVCQEHRAGQQHARRPGTMAAWGRGAGHGQIGRGVKPHPL